MKKRVSIKSIDYAPMMLTMLLGFGIYNNEDDVTEISNDKTWKLSRITTGKGEEQFYQDLWSNEVEEKANRELLKIIENLALNFNRVDVNSGVTGTVSVHAVKANISDTVLKIDGKEHTISISGKVYGSESDRLAKIFISDLFNILKYEGGVYSLTLYFEDGNIVKVTGLTVR